MIIREVKMTKESQENWLMRMTKEIRTQSKKLLIIIFTQLKIKRPSIPNVKIVEMDFEDWFPLNTDDYFHRHFKYLSLLDETINDFISSTMMDY